MFFQRNYLKNYWIKKGVDWNKSLHDGYFSLNESKIRTSNFIDNSLSISKKESNSIELEVIVEPKDSAEKGSCQVLINVTSDSNIVAQMTFSSSIVFQGDTLPVPW